MKYKKYITIIMVVIILLNTIAIPVKAEPLTLSAIWGGTVIAKQVLALVVALAGAGITIATQEQAYALYEDLNTNNPTLLQQMISVQPQVWTGAYNELTQDLNNIVVGTTTWLTSVFGELSTGINTSNSDITYIPGYNISFENRYYNVGGTHPHRYILTYLANDMIIYQQNLNMNLEAYNWKYSSISVTRNDVKQGYDLNMTHTRTYNHPTSGVTTISGTLVYTFTDTQAVAIAEQENKSNTITATISSDAPVLNPEWNAETDRKFPMPPLLLPKYPEIPIKEVTTPTGGKQLEYQGTIEEYLEDITNDKTWEDLDEYIKGQAPSTTLTPTGTGSLVVGGTITDGLPYPYPNTDAPTGVLEGLGTLGGIIQGIVNWLSKIFNAILSIPQLLTDIFSIPDNLALDFDTLRLQNIKNKFPFSIPWDLWKTISLFAINPTTPEIGVNIDTDYLKVNHQLDLQPIQIPLMFARYVATAFFIIYLVSKTRDMIKW